MIYSLDTNIVSYFLKDCKEREYVIKNYGLHESQGDDIIISPIVYYEIRRGLMKINSVKKSEVFNEMFSQFGKKEFNFEIWDKSSEIYFSLMKKGQMIDEMDILIAAFCIVNNYVLVTHNTSHFGRVSGLKYVDWTI